MLKKQDLFVMPKNFSKNQYYQLSPEILTIGENEYSILIYAMNHP